MPLFAVLLLKHADQQQTIESGKRIIRNFALLVPMFAVRLLHFIQQVAQHVVVLVHYGHHLLREISMQVMEWKICLLQYVYFTVYVSCQYSSGKSVSL
jgi:hypothetical protein